MNTIIRTEIWSCIQNLEHFLLLSEKNSESFTSCHGFGDTLCLPLSPFRFAREQETSCLLPGSWWQSPELGFQSMDKERSKYANFFTSSQVLPFLALGRWFWGGRRGQRGRRDQRGLWVPGIRVEDQARTSWIMLQTFFLIIKSDTLFLQRIRKMQKIVKKEKHHL